MALEATLTKKEVNIAVPRAALDAAVLAAKAHVAATSLSASGDYKITNLVLGGKDYEIRTCGKNNLLPNEREAALRKNYLFSMLLRTRRNITIGAGPTLFEKKYIDEGVVLKEVPSSADIKLFFEENKVQAILSTVCSEILKHGGCFVEFTRNLGGKIKTFRVIKNTFARVTLQDKNGFIPTILHCGNWAKSNKTENGEDFTVTAIPNYSGEAVKQNKFVMYFGDDFFHDGYYFDPIYVGIERWLDVSNSIPEFHFSNIESGYFLRMQVEYPHDYFKDYGIDFESLSEEEKVNENLLEQKRETKFLSKVNGFFEGAKNAGRTIFTKYEIERDLGKTYEGVRFKAINSELFDESMLKLQAAATEAIVSGAGLPPTLANISIQGKLSSGSEIRNAYNSYIEIHAPSDRAMILENTLSFIHKINGWGENLLWMFKDVKLETLDKNPAAKAEANPIA